jgi:hypothetical protein
MSKVEKKQGSKKRFLTVREKLWKQVNKKTNKVNYTFNPTLYEHSFFYEESPIKIVSNNTLSEDDGENSQWESIVSKIEWSNIKSNTCFDIEEDNDENSQWDSIVNKIEWSELECPDIE